MKTKILLYAFFLAFGMTQAQQVQWAHKLIKYSSDLGGKQNSIKRILGKPDAFPQGGTSPNAWMPKKALDGYEWVDVRSGYESSDVEVIMNGDIDNFLKAYLMMMGQKEE